MSAIFNGQQIKQSTIDTNLLTGAGEDLVAKLVLQLSSVPGFAALFGKYTPPVNKPSDDQQRWADYNRHDWSIRQLPAINVYESGVENRTSDNAWLNGTVTIMTLWPPSLRRADSRRIEAAYKGAINNFFSSKYATDMLDELYYIQRPMKVYGLNELGKQLNWTPNVEGLVEEQMVPVTILDISYRIDLRAWTRALEYMGRTVEDPFDTTLVDLIGIGTSDSGYQGVDDAGNIQVTVNDEIEVSNP